MSGNLFRKILPDRQRKGRTLIWTGILLLAVIFLIAYLNSVSLGR